MRSRRRPSPPPRTSRRMSRWPPTGRRRTDMDPALLASIILIAGVIVLIGVGAPIGIAIGLPSVAALAAVVGTEQAEERDGQQGEGAGPGEHPLREIGRAHV